MMKNITYVFLFLLVGNIIYAQEGRYGLSFANEQTTGSTLCVDVELRFKQGGKLGSSNLVMVYNKVKLGNPVFSSSTLSAAYSTATVTNPVDSLASFNIELLTENSGMTIATAPNKTIIGKVCFDVLAGMGAAYLDWHIKNTEATVVYLDDETTKLKRGRIEVLCNNAGETCDDGNPNTSDDKYDINCLCTGTQMDCTDDTNVDATAIPARIYRSRMKISSQGMIRPKAKVDFRAAQSITLGVGFHAEEGSEFTAMIEDCVDNLVEEMVESRFSEAGEFPVLTTTTPLQGLSLTISPNPIVGSATLTYVLGEAERVQLSLYSLRGKLVQSLFSGTQVAGMHLVDWQIGDLPAGMYFMRMETVGGAVVQKVVIE